MATTSILIVQEAKQDLLNANGFQFSQKLVNFKALVDDNNQDIIDNLKLVENLAIVFENVHQSMINLNTQLTCLQEPLEKASKYVFRNSNLNVLFTSLNEIIRVWNEKSNGFLNDLQSQTIQTLNGILNNQYDKLINYLKVSNEINEDTCTKLSRGISNFYYNQTKLKNFFRRFFHCTCKTLDTYSGYFDQVDDLLDSYKEKHKLTRESLDAIVNSFKNEKMFTNIKNDLNTSLPTHENSSGMSCTDSISYQLHQPKVNKLFGTNKQGYLLKHSSKSRMRKNWLKRKCVIVNGNFYIYHSDEYKQPVMLNLITCQIKSIENKRFKVFSGSNSRVYEFMAESECELNEWISVLNNSKSEALDRELSKENPCESMKELLNNILKKIAKLDGNQKCADCNAPDPDWLVTNLGILVCIECCGIHRELGVHISKTQSIKIDNLTTAQLINARMIGNARLNTYFEASLNPADKLHPQSQMDLRKKFIRLKYETHSFSSNVSINRDFNKILDLIEQKNSHSLFDCMLQFFASNFNLLTPINNNKQNLLHLIIINFEEINVLHLIDFILQNRDFSKSHFTIDYQDIYGNTAMHYCTIKNRIDTMKLILKAQANLMLKNEDGQTPLDVAISSCKIDCIKLLKQASNNQKIDSIEWIGLADEDYLSDTIDDADVTNPRSRPTSMVSFHNFDTSLDYTRQKVSHQRVLSETFNVNIDEPLKSQSVNGGVKVLPSTYQTRHTEKTSYKFYKKISSVSTSNLFLNKQQTLIKKPISSSSSNDLLYDDKPKKHSIKLFKSEARSPTYRKRSATNMTLSNLSNCKCKAIRSYSSDQLNHLTFAQNDMIIILENTSTDYWYGYLEGKPSKSGYFPSNYVNLYL